MNTFHRTPLGIDVDLLINNQWTSITGDARQSDGIAIERGGSFESSRIEPSRGRLSLDNRTGKYMLRNPMGAYYGSLQRNNEIRVSRRLIEATFTQTVSNAWPDTDTGQAWSTYGLGGTVQASDWSSTGGVARHSIPAADAHRLSYLATVSHRNIEALATFQLPFSDVTGSDISCRLVLRGQSTSAYLQMGASIQSDESILLRCLMADGSVFQSVATGIVHTGQRLRLCACIDGETIRGKIWPAGQEEPHDWLIDAHIGALNLISAAGWVGIRSAALIGNTNTKPVVVSWDDFVVRSPRLYGVVPDWPTEWDTSTNDSSAPIEIAGITRRLDNNDAPLQSALRRSIPGVPGLIAYWPCEDGRDSTFLASALPGVDNMDIFDGDVNMATFSEFKASAPIPTVNLSRWFGALPEYVGTGAVQTRFLMHVPSTGSVDGAIICQVFTYGSAGATAGNWELIYNSAGSGSLSLRVFATSGSVAATYGPFGFAVDGKLQRMSLELQNNGGNVDWNIVALSVGSQTAGVSSGTLAGYNIGNAVDVRFAVGNVMTDVAIGHVMVQSQITLLHDLWQELNAYSGETAGRRLERLCGEETVPFSWIGDLDNTAPMGPQLPGALLDLLQECVDADRGRLYETRTASGYTYLPLTAMYSRAAAVTLDLANKEVSPPLRPDDDTARVYNDIVVKREDGSSARAMRDTGPLAVSRIGRQDRQFTLSLGSDLQLADTAAWILHQSAVDDSSFPGIAVNLGHPALSGNDALSRAILDMELFERLTIKHASSIKIFDDINQIPGGSTEYLNAYQHTLSWNTSPESPYHVLTLDDTSEFGRLDSDTSTLENAITDSQTQFTVTVGDTGLWTEAAGDLPFNVLIGGERMTVTAVTPTVPSFVSAGTAAHADNASVSPGIPAGSTAGDLLLLFAANRNFSATVNLPTGYTSLLELANIRIMGKIHTGSESPPAVSFNSSVAGDTCSAQIAAFRNTPLRLVTFEQQFNSTSQDIDWPELIQPMADSVAVHMGWKQDDWTSVATVDGATEIGEPSSTLGNDQGLVWDYRVYRNLVAIPPGRFTVTGGAAANSRGMVLLLGSWQKFTATRSVNSVVKGHSAGTPVHVADAVYLGR